MKALVSLSGGMDSTTVLAYMLRSGFEAGAVGFHYGSKHNRFELEAAARIARHYDVPFRTLNLSGVFAGFKSNLLKGQGDIPEGHYTDASMMQTVVPARNIIFISILAGLAESIGAEVVAVGVHQGDHAIYPDCRPEFISSMDCAVGYGTAGKVRIDAPFLHTDKQGILRWGVEHHVPYDMTRTCYKEQELACGKCGSCVERKEAFAALGLLDLVCYE